jgi:hypothetical protein
MPGFDPRPNEDPDGTIRLCILDQVSWPGADVRDAELLQNPPQAHFRQIDAEAPPQKTRFRSTQRQRTTPSVADVETANWDGLATKASDISGSRQLNRDAFSSANTDPSNSTRQRSQPPSNPLQLDAQYKASIRGL